MFFAALALHCVLAAPAVDTVTAALRARPELSTFVAEMDAVRSGELLDGPAQFTVFAPSDAAYHKLPGATAQNLMLPENREALARSVNYVVVRGRFTTADITAAIERGHGHATLFTMEGDPLTATLAGGRIVLMDTRGNTASISAPDIAAGNGVVHVLDSVPLP